MPKLNSFQRVSVGLTTLDDTPAVAATFDTEPFGDDASFLVTYRISARQTDDATAVAGLITSVLFSRAGGTLAIRGAAVDQFSEGQSWTAVPTASGDNIILTVTGPTEVVHWLVEAEIQVNDVTPIFVAAPVA